MHRLFCFIFVYLTFISEYTLRRRVLIELGTRNVGKCLRSFGDLIYFPINFRACHILM